MAFLTTWTSSKLLERALAIQKCLYDSDHVVVAMTLGYLGIAYGVLGNLTKQMELLEQALDIEGERYYGPDHVELGRTLVNLGKAYGDLGDAIKQKELLERGLVILERVFGHNHLTVANTVPTITLVRHANPKH